MNTSNTPAGVEALMALADSFAEKLASANLAVHTTPSAQDAAFKKAEDARAKLRTALESLSGGAQPVAPLCHIRWDGDGQFGAWHECRASDVGAMPVYVSPPLSAGEAVAPVDVLLFCPKCKMQHIDTAEHWGGAVEDHRSHLCVPAAGGCGHIWRASDSPTNGIEAVKTRGKNDSPLASGEAVAQPVAYQGIIMGALWPDLWMVGRRVLGSGGPWEYWSIGLGWGPEEQADVYRHDDACAAYDQHFPAPFPAASQVQPANAEGVTLLPLNDDVREILGRMCFQCIAIAQVLRASGFTIATKAEDEQAVVIHWLLTKYLEHGSAWRQEAEKALRAMNDAALEADDKFAAAPKAVESEQARDAGMLLKAANDAATSLETIASLAGRKFYGNPPIETFMEHPDEIRSYARSRANAARQEIAAALPASGAPAAAPAGKALRWLTDEEIEAVYCWAERDNMLDRAIQSKLFEVNGLPSPAGSERERS